MTTALHAQQLLALLARTSFRLGQFTLSSGGTSDYYIDCRTTTLHAEGGRLTGHAILELLEARGIEADAVGGLTMGADPIVSNVATASAWRAQSNPAAPLLHGFLVRKAEKAHGTGRRIEGFCRAGRARGHCGRRLHHRRFHHQRHRGCPGSRHDRRCRGLHRRAAKRPTDAPPSKAAAQGAPFLSLFTANDVRAEHIRQ